MDAKLFTSHGRKLHARREHEALTGLVESVAQVEDVRGARVTPARADSSTSSSFGTGETRAGCSSRRGGRTGATAPRWEGRAAGGCARAFFKKACNQFARVGSHVGVAELGYVVVASRPNSLLARYCDVQDRVGDGG